MSKPVFTDDREKQDPVLGNGDGDGDGAIDSDDSRPDLIITELVAEGNKNPSLQFAKRSLTILFASFHRSSA
jgi:hypothetical protein